MGRLMDNTTELPSCDLALASIQWAIPFDICTPSADDFSFGISLLVSYHHGRQQMGLLEKAC